MGHLATLNFSLGEDIDMLRDTVDLRRTRLPRGLRRSKKRTFSRPVSGASSETSVSLG